MNIADAIRDHARRRPMHPAVVYRGDGTDYATLDRRVDAAVALLRKWGIRGGDHVAIALDERPEHLIFLFGAARLGAVFVPIDCRWTLGEKQRVGARFRAKLILLNPGDSWNDDMPAVHIGDDWNSAKVVPHASEMANAEVNLPLAVYLTSGTTGKPKGPLLTHANLHARFLIYRNSLQLNENDRFACVTPLYFSASRGFAMCALHAGATVVLLPPPMAAGDLIDAINRTGCTSASMVPTLIRRMIGECKVENPCLPGLRTLISTGATLNSQEHDQALHALSPNLFSFYGSSEGGGVAVLRPDHPSSKAGSAGAIISGTEVRIVDESGKNVAPNEVGRICYRSAATATGFYEDAEETARTFRDGWFFPGDLGRIDSEGFVWISGREKDMIIRGGANIYPEEIERVLRAHPDVADAAVVGAPSPEFGEEIVAYVSLRKNVADGELLDWCRRELAPYKLPRRIQRLADLPKTAFGKVDKLALKARAAAMTE